MATRGRLEIEHGERVETFDLDAGQAGAVLAALAAYNGSKTGVQMPLTKYERGEIARLAELGWSMTRIAQALGRSYSTIYANMPRENKPPERPQYPVSARLEAVERYYAGETAKKIAEDMGCHINSVFTWVKRYGRGGKRAADARDRGD